ncbi:MAG TPA: serine/threonine-protein kinase, partial [Ktedonobacteraceae bacterium]|nr:serine/threonine-protein kinase [Ktedonobacteraceae bacterium]
KQPLSDLYLAQSVVHNEKVIIKSFNAPPLQSEQGREHFLQEVTFFKQLRHPHILPVLDGGINEHPYIVSACAPNGSLQQRLTSSEASRHLTFQDALGVVMQIGHALSYAHERDILHTRVKPENVLFDADGNALLADFRLSSLGAFSNTMARPYTKEACYVAPERFSGTLSKEVDQYALGCLAYELFTGQSPFMAAVLSTWQHTYASSAEPMPFTQRMPEIPEYVSAAILKALSKEPAQRHASVDSFLQALVEAPEPSVSMEQATSVEEQRAVEKSIPTVSPTVGPDSTEKVSSAPANGTAARVAAEAEVHAALTQRVLQANGQVAQLRMPPHKISRRRLLHGKYAKLWVAIAASLFVLSGVILAVSALHAFHTHSATTQTPPIVAMATSTVQPRRSPQQHLAARPPVLARTRAVPHVQHNQVVTPPGRTLPGNSASTGSSVPPHHVPATPARPRPQPLPTQPPVVSTPVPTQPPVVPTPVPTQPPVVPTPVPRQPPVILPPPQLPLPTPKPTPMAPPHPGPAARPNGMLAGPDSAFVQSLLHDCCGVCDGNRPRGCSGHRHVAHRHCGEAIIAAMVHWLSWAGKAS